MRNLLKRSKDVVQRPANQCAKEFDPQRHVNRSGLGRRDNARFARVYYKGQNREMKIYPD